MNRSIFTKLGLFFVVLGGTNIEAAYPPSALNIPVNLSPGVLKKKAEFEEIYLKAAYKIRFAENKIEALKETKNGLQETFNALYAAFPEEGREDVKSSIDSFIDTCVSNISNATSDRLVVSEEEIEATIDDVVSQLKGEDTDALVEITRSAFSTASSILESGKNRLLA